METWDSVGPSAPAAVASCSTAREMRHDLLPHTYQTNARTRPLSFVIRMKARETYNLGCRHQFGTIEFQLGLQKMYVCECVYVRMREMFT